MALVLDFRDVRFIDCPREFRGDNEEDVLQKALCYARRKHNIIGVVPKLLEELRSAIQEEPQVW